MYDKNLPIDHLELQDLATEDVAEELAAATNATFSTTSSFACAGSCGGTIGTGSTFSSAALH